MQVALPLGKTIEKQTVGLAALVLAGMAMTPLDLAQPRIHDQLGNSLTVIKGSQTVIQLDTQAPSKPSAWQELQSEQKYRISIAMAAGTRTDREELAREKLDLVKNNNTSNTSNTSNTPDAPNTQRTAGAGSLFQVSTNPELNTGIIKSALSWEGVPYLYGGESRAGVDCSALVQIVYSQYGISLPRTARDQYGAGVGISRNSLRPGDLVFFSTNGPGASHVGIYLGDNKFISATKRKVEIQDLTDKYWNNTYHGGRRVLG